LTFLGSFPQSDSASQEWGILLPPQIPTKPTTASNTKLVSRVQAPKPLEAGSEPVIFRLTVMCPTTSGEVVVRSNKRGANSQRPYNPKAEVWHRQTDVPLLCSLLAECVPASQLRRVWDKWKAPVRGSVSRRGLLDSYRQEKGGANEPEKRKPPKRVVSSRSPEPGIAPHWASRVCACL